MVLIHTINSVTKIICHGLALASLGALIACGGSITDHVYWPARDIFQTLEFESSELNDRRWNDTLIIPSIRGSEYHRKDLFVFAISKEAGTSLYFEEIVLYSNVNSGAVSGPLVIKVGEEVMIEDRIQETKYYSGSKHLIFKRESKIAKFLDRENYHIRIIFRSHKESHEQTTFDYPIVSRTRWYPIAR